MTVRVFLGSADMEISSPLIEGVSVISDIQEMYCTGEIVLKDLSGSLINEVKLGTIVSIQYDTDSSISYKNRFRVFSFQKSRDAKDSRVDVIRAQLISSWYYRTSSVKNLAYKGNYGQWVSQLANYCFGNEVDYDSFATDDSPKVRYMLSKRPQEFLQETMRYGTISSMPVYLHTLPINKVVVSGIADLMSDTDPNIVLYSQQIIESQGKTEAAYTQDSTAVSLPTDKLNIPMLTYNFNTNTDLGSSSVRYQFSTDLFDCKTASHNIKAYTMNSLEDGNTQVDTISPAREAFVGWEYTPDDAVALAVKSGLEEVFSTFTLSTTVHDNPIDSIYPGTMVKVLLPNAGDDKSATECGLYLVKRAAYQYIRGVLETKLVLVQTTN